MKTLTKNIIAVTIFLSASAIVAFAAETNTTAQCPMQAKPAQCTVSKTNAATCCPKTAAAAPAAPAKQSGVAFKAKEAAKAAAAAQ